MNWSNSWDDKPKTPLRDLGAEYGMPPIIQVNTQSFSEILKEQNALVDPWLKGISKSNVVIGVDKGSPDGDKTIISIVKDGKILLVGEDVTIIVPINAWVDKTVRAYRVGDLAVVAFEEDFDWAIIHVPTLTRFDNAIPEGDWEFEQYLMWCWKVQQSCYHYWEDLQKFNNKTYKNIDKSYLEDFKHYCLSVPMEN